MKTLTAADRRDSMAALERVIDGYGLATVLDMLAEVCADKADHVRENWQDEALANLWSNAAGRLQGQYSRALMNGL